MNRKSNIQKWSPGFLILNGSLAFLFSLMWTLGVELDQKSNMALGWHHVTFMLVFAAGIFPVLAWLTKKLDSWEGPSKGCLGRKELKKFYLIIVVIWLLGYLAMFPGVYATDAAYWYYEFIDENVPVNIIWSPIYAGLFFSFVEAGKILFDSWDIGFACFTLVQMGLVLLVIRQILFFLNEFLGRSAVILSTIFFSFVPTHVILAVTSATDPLFAACFAMCLLHLIRLAYQAEEYVAKRSNLVRFGAYLIALCLIRNNGIYSLIVLALAGLILGKRYRQHLLKVLAVVFACVLVCQGPVYTKLGVQAGYPFHPLAVMLSVPLQQMAYVYNNEALPQELKNEMDLYVTEEAWNEYPLSMGIADTVRRGLNVDFVQEHLWDFVKLYGKVMKFSPKSMVKGLFFQTYGLWYPGKIYPDISTWHPYLNYQSYTYVWSYDTGFTLHRISLFPLYDHVLGWLFGEGERQTGYVGDMSMTFSNIPVLSTLCKAGTYTWLLLYAACYAVYRRWKGALVILSFPIGIWITVFLSPVIMYRYAAPIIFSAPLIMAALFLKWDQPNVGPQQRV